MKYQNFNDDNAANRKINPTGFAANRKFYLRVYVVNRKFYLRVCASDRKFYKTRSAFKRKFSFCLKEEKRRKPKQPSPWETVGAIVATHPPAPCPPSGQSRTCLLRRSYGGDEGTVSDAFEAVTEGMVLDDEIEQHGSLLLYFIFAV
jgi:hypothetical protein